MMDALLLDIRYALRRLAGTPGFTIGAVLSLALGIGASTVIFSAVNGVVLRPLSYPDAHELVFLPRSGDVEADVSRPDMVELRRRTRSFAAMAAFAPGWSLDLVGEGEPERLLGSVVEYQYFDVLRLAPLHGRYFGADEDRAGGAHVAVLSEAFWRRRFGADPAVVGRTITISDNATRIVGVAPAALDVLDAGIDVFLPLAPVMPWALEERGSNHLEAIARLAPGVALPSAVAETDVVTRAMVAEFPRTNGGKILVPTDLRQFMVGEVRTPLFVLMGAIGLVLLITCVNLTNFLLARAAGRRQELAVRLALGAGRGRVLRQLLSESVAVALAGGAVGVLFAVWGRDLVTAVGPETLPRLDEVRLDWRVLAFSFGLALAAGVFVGLAPAIESWRGAPADALGGAGRGSAGRARGRRLDLLATVQVALATVLLIGAALLGRSFNRLQSQDTGFQPAGLIAGDIVLPESRYSDREAQTRAFSSMVAELEATPGVEDAAFVIGLPLGTMTIGHTVLLEDRPHTGDNDGVGARVRPVVGDYFRLMGIPVIQGRALASSDNEGAPKVVVINERFARQAWPHRSPLGERIAFRTGDSLVWRTVVGVVGDVRATSLAQGDTRAVYFPFQQRDATWQRFGSLVIKVRGEPEAAGRALREAVWRVDPRVPLSNVQTMEHQVRASVARQRFSATALGAFAIGALLIAVQGIYAVLAYAVTMRQREIGIRIALGAERLAVVRMVLRRGVAAAALGLVIGLAGAMALSRVLSTVLFETAPTDVTAYAAAAALLGSVAVVASWLPARRAARVDPMVALRND